MGNKPVFSRSSNLVALPALGIELLGGILAAFFGQWNLAAAVLFVFLLCAVARLWAVASLRHVSITVSTAIRGLFPDEEAHFDIEVHNGKFLPLIWLEVYFPLTKNLCLVPEDSRPPDHWEVPVLEETGASAELVGEKRFTFFLWYETLRFTSRWTAKRRGVYSTAPWRLRTGDGFGLAQVERPISKSDVRQFVVYPRLISVSPELFLRNLWNAESGSRGVMEDPTIIRSTRDYQSTDSLKHINWRLRARGLPLAVNVYEDILPRGVHFLLDGESFAQHPEELEDALSILASELVVLAERQLHCGLSICRSGSGRAVNFFAAASSTEDLLCALAAYEPLPPIRDSESGELQQQDTVFDAVPLFEPSRSVGRFYYITYDTSRLPDQMLLRRLDHTCLTVLTYCEPVPFGEFETVGLCHLKGGTGRG